jgi:hypothetical protein
MGAGDADKLTPKQQRAIAALLSAPTIRKAAEEVGVTDRTVHEWLRDRVFKAAYREAQRESFKHSIAITQKYMPHAVQTLVQIMADKDAPKNVRVTAALGLMKYGRESIELDDVVERVEKLEADTAAREKAGPGGYGGRG